MAVRQSTVATTSSLKMHILRKIRILDTPPTATAVRKVDPRSRTDKARQLRRSTDRIRLKILDVQLDRVCKGMPIWATENTWITKIRTDHTEAGFPNSWTYSRADAGEGAQRENRLRVDKSTARFPTSHASRLLCQKRNVRPLRETGILRFSPAFAQFCILRQRPCSSSLTTLTTPSSHSFAIPRH